MKHRTGFSVKANASRACQVLSSFVKPKPNQAEKDEVQRIIPIEKPFAALSLSAFPVIERQNRDGKYNTKLQQTIDKVQEQAIDHAVADNAQHHIHHLLTEVAACRCYTTDGKHGNTAPIRRKGCCTQHKKQRKLRRLREFFLRYVE